jgi:hypothetical protein
MRSRYRVLALALMMLGVQAVPAVAQGQQADVWPAFDHAFATMSKSYYAALLGSARGNTEGTLRNVIALSGAWERLAAMDDSNTPKWFHERALKASVRSSIEDAHRHLPRAVGEAHAELERIRILLRDARSTRGQPTFDDAVTEYHGAMERLAARIGVRNEIALESADFERIHEDTVRAQSAWAQVTAKAPSSVAGFERVGAGTTAALQEILKATAAHDSAAAQHASERLKNDYFDLIAALAR